MTGIGYTDRFLTAEETREIVTAGLASLSLAGKRVLFIIPDGTRTMPMPQFFGLFQELLAGKAKAVDFLVALGTHRPMDDSELSRLVGVPVVEGRAGASRIFNHEWADPATFATIGEISAAEIAKLSGGRLEKPVTVALNKLIFDYDQIVICGPVFPHEVVGFSGGNKYFFPRHRRRRRHQLHALAGRAHHQLRNHRQRLHARARGHRSCGRRWSPCPPRASRWS
jgi:nickel-dependent lactate racemase